MISHGNEKTKYIARVKACIHTILEVKERLESVYGELELLKDMKLLEGMEDNIDPNRLSESDVVMLEWATNNLMNELAGLFKAANIKPLYSRDLIN